MNIRLIQPDDMESVLNIYAPYIQNTAITFEYQVPSLADFSRRIEGITSFYPFLVAETEAGIAGYAYACKHRSRKAYEWSVESSVYIQKNYQGKGIAKALYQSLFQMLKLQGIVNVYAGITLPSIKSESFHKAMGFEPVGIYQKVGYKLGKWHDVLWMALSLQEHAANPVEPVSFKEI
jgi:phosphinothricin acetyltransferase